MLILHLETKELLILSNFIFNVDYEYCTSFTQSTS